MTRLALPKATFISGNSYIIQNSNIKLGRNAPCWCHSGKKFKKCHLNREFEKPPSLEEIAKSFEDSKKKICVVPKEYHIKCSGKIINAHTVSKSSSLKKIAKDGHVYKILKNVNESFLNSGSVIPKLIGINKASTFTGFCQAHDRELFSPIENRKFVWEPEQIFLTAYRSLIYEWYAKYSVVSMEEFHRKIDAGKPLYAQIKIQREADLNFKGHKLALKELDLYKEKFEEILSGEDYSRINYIGFEFDNYLPIMGSGGFTPVFDLLNRKIQDLSKLDVPAQTLYYSSFSDGIRGMFCLAWLNGLGNVGEEFAKSINGFSNEQVGNVILNTLFVNSENIYLKPEWWDGLSNDNKNYLLWALKDSMNPEAAVKNYRIKDIIEVNVTKRYSNIDGKSIH